MLKAKQFIQTSSLEPCNPNSVSGILQSSTKSNVGKFSRVCPQSH